jgi:hypothetical protein
MKHVLPPLPDDHAALELHADRSAEMDRWENEGGRLAAIN